jgi:phage shock protein C
MDMTARFALDKRNARLMGVCAGFARWTGIDPTIVRVAAVLLTLLGVGSTVILYLLVGLIAPSA